MQTATVTIKKLDPRATTPTYGSEQAAGADLYAVTDGDVTIAPGETVLIHTGLSMELPVGYVGLIYARSGLPIRLASSTPTTVANFWLPCTTTPTLLKRLSTGSALRSWLLHHT